jgi:hypothetical protein
MELRVVKSVPQELSELDGIRIKTDTQSDHRRADHGVPPQVDLDISVRSEHEADQDPVGSAGAPEIFPRPQLRLSVRLVDSSFLVSAWLLRHQFEPVLAR